MITSRKVTAEDRSQLENWITNDPDHQGQSADFWLPDEKEPNIQRYVIRDEEGDIFYVRGENILRLHIQFAPGQKERTARAVDEYTKIVSDGAKKL